MTGKKSVRSRMRIPKHIIFRDNQQEYGQINDQAAASGAASKRQSSVMSDLADNLNNNNMSQVHTSSMQNTQLAMGTQQASDSNQRHFDKADIRKMKAVR